MIFSRNNRFLQRILSAHIWDMVYFFSFAKCKKAWKFHSLPLGGTVLSPPPYITRPLCPGHFLRGELPPLCPPMATANSFYKELWNTWWFSFEFSLFLCHFRIIHNLLMFSLMFFSDRMWNMICHIITSEQYGILYELNLVLFSHSISGFEKVYRFIWR